MNEFLGRVTTADLGNEKKMFSKAFASPSENNSREIQELSVKAGFRGKSMSRIVTPLIPKRQSRVRRIVRDRKTVLKATQLNVDIIGINF